MPVVSFLHGNPNPLRERGIRKHTKSLAHATGCDNCSRFVIGVKTLKEQLGQLRAISLETHRQCQQFDFTRIRELGERWPVRARHAPIRS